MNPGRMRRCPLESKNGIDKHGMQKMRSVFFVKNIYKRNFVCYNKNCQTKFNSMFPKGYVFLFLGKNVCLFFRILFGGK